MEREVYDAIEVPRVAETVIMLNDHGFPRAAIVTGTAVSLVGEQHVMLLEHPLRVHLHVLSPLPREYNRQNVGHWSLRYVDPSNNGNRMTDVWLWPDEYDGRERTELTVLERLERDRALG